MSTSNVGAAAHVDLVHRVRPELPPIPVADLGPRSSRCGSLSPRRA
ncbi:MAG: hypothetical protein KGJ98_01820 [Chloroflexota bacterium]|nr:hypothetical protein [Chloroflexota bacterium]MDE3100952.1 hypothetical protein [Chloroflexota bacterium]